MLSFLALFLGILSEGCSNWMMKNDYMLSGRTMDLKPTPFEIVAVPQGQARGLPEGSNRYGYLAWAPRLGPVHIDRFVLGGMNEAGLSCDMQHLKHTKHPKKDPSQVNINADQFCEWALAGFSSAEDLHRAMKNVTIIKALVIPDQHFIVRDAKGVSLVAEFLEGKTHAYLDYNDDGKTGFGITTNEPPLEFHITNVKHFQWKRSCARSAVGIPGAFYPDDRFLRIFMFREGMSEPKSYKEAVLQAVHILNSVTLPVGLQYGTDAGDSPNPKKSGKDYEITLYGVIYDHLNKTLYWRTNQNQSLQRLRISDLDLKKGAKSRSIHSENDLPWFLDVSNAFMH